MARRAIWRTSPEDPRSFFRLLLADRNRYLKPPLRVLGCLTIVGTVYFLVQGELLAGLFFFGLSTLLPRLRMRTKPVGSLLTVPLPAPAYPCTVDVTRDGATIGWDRGVVTFVDGWLHFEGHRTSFSLSRSDVTERRENEIEFQRGGVAFYPDDNLSHASLRQTGLQARFASQLDRWYRLDSAARGVSVLPPLSVHPTGLARAWADLLASFLQFGLVVGLFWAVMTLFDSMVAFVFLGFSGDFVQSVLNFRKIYGLRREERRLSNDPKPAIGQ